MTRFLLALGGAMALAAIVTSPGVITPHTASALDPDDVMQPSDWNVLFDYLRAGGAPDILPPPASAVEQPQTVPPLGAGEAASPADVVPSPPAPRVVALPSAGVGSGATPARAAITLAMVGCALVLGGSMLRRSHMLRRSPRP